MAPLARTHSPPRVTGRDGHAKYRPCLRLDFAFRCAYGLAHEREVGPSENYGGFEIEHFRPQGLRKFRRLANSYANLLWACPTCNRAKLHTWPGPEEAALGMRLVDPTEEALGEYLTLRGDVVVGTEIPSRSQAASYMIDVVRLNGAAHQERRRRKTLAVKIATLEATLEVFREDVDAHDEAKLAQIAAAEKELADFAAMIGASLPWDAPQACHCPPDGTPAVAASPRRQTRRSRKKRRSAVPR